MKHTALACMALFAAFGVFAQAPDLDSMDVVLKSVPDGPVAKVQGTNIESADFVRLYRTELGRVMRENGSTDIPDVARVQLAMLTLGTLVERELLYREALDTGLTVSEESVSKAWEAQQAQVRRSLMGESGRELPEADILSKLGYTDRSQVLDRLERALLTEKMRATVLRESGVSISDEQIDAAIAGAAQAVDRPSQMHLKQIFIDPKKDPDGARKRAEDALGRVFAGQRFEAVAKAFSEAPDAVAGGDMGMLSVTQLPPFMIAAVEEIEPGDITDIIESEFGLHIVMLVERMEARQRTREELEPLVRRGLLAEQGVQLVHSHCEALVQDGAEVLVFLELNKNLSLTTIDPGSLQD